MSNRVGQQLGNYRLASLLGQGGFAGVYLAEHIHLGTRAAIKVLNAHLTSDSVEHFRSEARTVARLTHPHIIRVLDFGVEENIPYLAMDYAPNGSIRQHHPKGIRLPLDTIVSYVKQVATALQYAHEKKLIHRDVKPENLLLGEHHQVLLGDFGIALIVQSTQYQSMQEIIGTAPYMAPEQLQGKPRLASDQYSLGIVVYEWICGNPPFHGTFIEICSQQMLVPPPSLCEKVPELPFPVEEVIRRALAKDPKERFNSVQAFANALELANERGKSSVAVTDPGIPPPSLLPAMQVEMTLPQPHLVPGLDAHLTKTLPASPTNSPDNDSDAPETKPKRVWSISKHEFVAMAIGAILYGSLGQFETFLQLPGYPFRFPIFPAIVIPQFFGAYFGPWVGLFTGLVGCLIEQRFSGYPYAWKDNLGLAMIGFIAGLAKLRTRGHYGHTRAIVFAQIICTIGLAIGIGCGTYGYVFFANSTVAAASRGFIVTGLSDLTLSLILLPPILVIFSRIDERVRNT
jgi:serine/threonine protein kinase/uncharacterized membrane protein